MSAEMPGLQRFQEALRDLNQRVSGDPDLTSREREEGYAYIAGIAHMAIERGFVCADADYPRFVSCINPFSRWGLESVDNLYLCADVRPGISYLIRGNTGNCADVVYETLTNMVGDDGVSLGEGIGSIDFGTLRIEPSGDYSILVAADRGEATNFLPSGPRINTVFLRKTINNWDDVDAGWQTIERIGNNSPPTLFDAPGDADRRWQRAADLLRNQVAFLDKFAKSWPDILAANAIGDPTCKGSGYLPGQYNAPGRFELGPGQALVISVTPIACRHMSVAVGHFHWFCSFDGGVTPSQLNREQSHLASDGRYHYVVAAQDPGVPNWIDTSGHLRGFTFCRWQGVTGDAPQAPGVVLVDLADLGRHLPGDTPRVTRDEHLRRVRGRRLALDRRYAL